MEKKMMKQMMMALILAMMPPTCLLCLLSPFNRLSARRCVFAFPVPQKSALRDVNRDFAMWR